MGKAMHKIKLNGIELVLGVNWLQATNPLIDWSQPRLLIGHNKMVYPISAQWLPSIHKTGTVKDVNPDDISNTDAFAFAKSLEKLQAPKFWDYTASVLPWRPKAPQGGGSAANFSIIRGNDKT